MQAPTLAHRPMPLFWKHYKSDTTSLIEALRARKPTLEEEQRNAKVRNVQMDREFDKAIDDYAQQLQISAFDSDSYRHVKDLFDQDLIGLDKLMMAQQKALQSELAVIGAKWNSEWVKNKIHISNAK